MAHPFFVALHGAGIQLPDGRILFHDLHEALGRESVGLIGHNGSGKSTLGRAIAGEAAVASGRIERPGRARYVEQQTGPTRAANLAELAGLAPSLAALRRLAAGAARDEDFALVGERWDLETHWQAMLEQAGLAETMAPAGLSGGQRTLLTLVGAFCSDADLLVLDEPGNHLDRGHRAFLLAQMHAWRQAGRGLLLISHDRELLEHVDRILEVRASGLRRYGGNWTAVGAQRAAELRAASARLERARVERREGEAQMREQAARAVRRHTRGVRAAAAGGQPRIVLNAQPQRAQQTDGARAVRHTRQREALQAAVSEAYALLEDMGAAPAFPLLDVSIPEGQVALAVDALVASWGPRQPVSWAVSGPARIALCGPNGCGKSTLLRTIAGQLAPREGQVRCLPGVLIDQQLGLLDPALSLLQQMRAAAPGLEEGHLRQMLARAGLGPKQVLRPSSTLSGGERMRGSLLLAVLGQPAPRVLMLDEPTNHLDLAGTEALEAMLASWEGALVVVSHDERFLQGLSLSHRLEWGVQGWTLVA